MNKALKLILIIVLCAVAIPISIGIGSVRIPLADTLGLLTGNITDEVSAAILLKIRIPRSILAFAAGSALAVSGVIMQSLLRNPLASSLTLGVSSGAALGASIAIILGINIFGFLTLPIFGLSAGLLTVFLSITLASRIDRMMQSNTIILMGMAFSLFANAMITIIMSTSADQLQRLVFWQMGSFAMKTPTDAAMLVPVAVVGCVVAMCFSREMDIMTLGDEQAQTSGVAVKQMKWLLLGLSAVITGATVSLVGIIGFVDLFTPHAARKLFGASHKYVLPASALLGGLFMLICDLAARTLASPLELPVGAITSVIGAPFFIYLYFNGRRRRA